MHHSATLFPRIQCHLRFVLAAASIFGCLFTAHANADSRRTIAVPPQIREWKEEVEAKHAALASKYGFKPAPKTLLAAYDEGGVMWAKRYSSSWGGWIYNDWDVAQDLHQRTLRQIQTVINQHKGGDPITREQLDQLGGVMDRFRAHNTNYVELFKLRVDHDVRQALELDFKHDHELAKLAAIAAGNRELAEFHQTMINHYAKHAADWRKRGAAVSKQIRDIGYRKSAIAAR